MKLTYEDYDQLSVFTLKGEFSGEDQAESFKTTAQERLAGKVRDVVLDLESLEFIDSLGLETLLWLQDTCAEKLGQVRLAAASESIDDILRVTRLNGRFDCHAEVDAAIKSLR